MKNDGELIQKYLDEKFNGFEKYVETKIIHFEKKLDEIKGFKQEFYDYKKSNDKEIQTIKDDVLLIKGGYQGVKGLGKFFEWIIIFVLLMIQFGEKLIQMFK